MKRKTLILAAAALGAAGAIAALALRQPGAQADGKPPEQRFAEAYYGEMKAGYSAKARAYFGRGVPMENGGAWPELLRGLDEAAGRIASVRYLGSTDAPQGGMTCHWLQYEVQRRLGRWQENLMVCPGPMPEDFVIEGHQVVDLDRHNEPIGVGNQLYVQGAPQPQTP